MKLSLIALVYFSVSSMAAPLDCSKVAGALPDSSRAAGVADAKNPIEHVIVIMQENHSFDQYFGQLTQSRYYGAEVEGLKPGLGNPDSAGNLVAPYHETSLCPKDPIHGWDGEHKSFNGGAGDGFVRLNGPTVVGYYDQNDINYYYDLADKFAIGDHYFCSALTQTIPNRLYSLTGTSFGIVRNDLPAKPDQYSQKIIFETLNENGVSWKYYCDSAGYPSLFQPFAAKNKPRFASMAAFQRDLKNGTLPAVVFIDANAFEGEDEHPAGNIQAGQAWVAARGRELMKSHYWKSTVLFLTYDENGGYYDHVIPPPACLPDNIEPNMTGMREPGRFDRLGFRVPFIAISPYVKHHYVSHNVYDHTSILKFIETKFNLPALTSRDANADAMLDLFDFAHPVMDTVLVKPSVDTTRKCH
ncbi:MAG: phospholipase C [Bdellovibrionales bacterium]